MLKIYLIGDMHTVSALRLAGVAGVVCDEANAAASLEAVIAKADAGIILITQALANGLQARITEINLSGGGTVIMAMPGIDEPLVLERSIARYIAEALGIAL